MKKSIRLQSVSVIFILSFFFGISSLLIGCSSEQTGTPFRWKKIDPKVDSLTQQIDRMFYLHEPDEEIKIKIDSLKSVARLTGTNKDVADRISFFDARYSYLEGDEEKYETEIDRLLNTVDSSSNPYLYNRIIDFSDDGGRWNVEEYDRINILLDYFKKRDDDILTAASLINLGNLMKNIRDPRRAISLYEEADSLLKKNGMDRLVLFNRMNIATAQFILRDTVKGVAILEKMRQDPIVKNDPAIMEKVLHNLYIDGGVREALDSLYQLTGSKSSSLIETFMSNALLNEGDISGAVSHADMAVEKAVADDSDNDYAIALYAQSDALSAAGDTAKAYKSLLKAVEITDEIGLANEPEAIKNVETDRLLSMRRLEAELAKSRWQLRFVCIGFGILLVLGGTILFLRKRVIKLHLQRKEISEEKEKIARKLVATQIAMDETDKVLSSVGKAVGELKEANDSSEQTREIANAIHTHKARNIERENFIDSFATVHPDFARRLKDKNPAITEPDVRLASYIVTGMDNKMIAATMGIRPESVKQARWRLRTKLGLPKGASLEEALRELNRF